MNIKLAISAIVGVISFTYSTNILAKEMVEQPSMQEEKVVQLPDANVMGASVVNRNPTAVVNEEEDINYVRNINHHRNIFNLNHTHMHKTYNHKLSNHHKYFTKVHNRFSQSSSVGSTYSVNDTHEVMPTEEVTSNVVNTVMVNRYLPYINSYPYSVYANNLFCHPFYAGRFVRLCRGF